VAELLCHVGFPQQLGDYWKEEKGAKPPIGDPEVLRPHYCRDSDY
jgi:hypothetical protein